MKLISQNQAIHVDKTNGTEVDYYLLEDAEIHYNKINPHTLQEWHRHHHISENIFILKGELVYRYLDEIRHEQFLLLKQGDLLSVENDIHTFENQTDEVVEFIVFRYLPSYKNQREMIKNDKEVIER
ncbi:MAG: cupin domain-containing protein [Bacillota bacterium]|nr:cupin domain-containing protein [Bacillota bacterium]